MAQAISNRLDYPCLENHCYLNQASLGLIGEPSVLAMRTFLDEVARYGNLKMSDKEEAAFLDPLRSRIAQLINAKKNNIAIISSASEILGQLPYLISPKKKNKVVLISTDFPAITRPWIAYSHKKQIKICFVKEGQGKSLTDQIIHELDEETCAVSVSYVQFSSGVRLNIPKLRAATNAYGTKLIVDITQAAGAIPISVADWCADLVVCSGYKWLGGHGGIAFASFSDQLLKKPPVLVGWFGSSDPFKMDATTLLLSKTAAKYTQSTLSYISAVGLKIAIDKLCEIGVCNIETHAKKLSAVLTNGLTSTRWNNFCKTKGEETSSHIISLQKPNSNAQKTFHKLKKNQIMCGVRNNRLRISIAHYNNEEDIQRLLFHLR